MIAVSGANGYVGGRILAGLREGGVEALALVRRPQECAGPARRFALCEPLAEGTLEGVEAVIHAAWDASARGAEVDAVNVQGSLPLLDGAAARGARLLLISSLSAFSAARSRYGRAKFALERAVHRREGLAVRPGLVFGIAAGGLFGSLVGTSSERSPMPIVGGLADAGVSSEPAALAYGLDFIPLAARPPTMVAATCRWPATRLS